METYDAFTLRSRRMQCWLAGEAVVAAGVVALFPPSFWLCGVGLIVFTCATLANSARTGQWYTWQRLDTSVSWFEGWAALSGLILIAVPVIGMLVRAYTIA